MTTVGAEPTSHSKAECVLYHLNYAATYVSAPEITSTNLRETTKLAWVAMASTSACSVCQCER